MTTDKQADYKRSDEQCFKGQSVEFMTCRKKEVLLNTAVGTLRAGPRGQEHTQMHRSQVAETKTEYSK